MNTLDSTPSVSTEKGKIPESRVRDATQGHQIYSALQKADEDAQWKRSCIDLQIDGGLPYDEQAMIDAGRGDEANVNFMEAKAEDDSAQTPFIEMTTVPRILFTCRTSHGDTNQQNSWGQIISEEFTRTIRDWGSAFDYYRLRLSQQFTRHGLGFIYWQDEKDWRWRSDGPNAFKIPRDIESLDTQIPYCTCERSMTVDELYKFIRNEERAKEVGRWNVDAVKQAIVDSKWKDKRRIWRDGSWDEFVKEAKENDLVLGATCPKVFVYHLWVTEFNGSISHYIGLQSGAAKDDNGQIGNGFLYVHRSRFKSMAQCVIPFFYGVGTHGTVHTVRGQGELNFSPIAISNRARCDMLNSISASASVLLQADSPNDAESAAVVRRGAFTFLIGNAKVQPTAIPDVSTRFLPALRDMQMLRQNLTGSFQSRAITEQGAQERTKYEVQAQQAQGSQLDSARMSLFFGPWSRTGKEMYRRMTADGLRDDDPGGAEAMDFRKRCMNRDVPEKALKEVYYVEAVRSVGHGSPEARQYTSEKVLGVMGRFDQPGQRNALLEYVASLPGMDYKTAEDYVGPEQPRLTVDDQVATLENADFRAGQAVPVVDGQNAWVHCQYHAQLVNEVVGAFEQGEIGGEQLVPVLKPALDNMLQHAEQLNQDPMREQEAAYVRQFIQQNNGVLQQQEQKLIAEMQRQQEAAQQQGEPMSGDEQRKWEAHQQDIQIRQQELALRQREVEQKLQLQEQEAQSNRRQKDLELAANIAEKRAKLREQPATIE